MRPLVLGLILLVAGSGCGPRAGSSTGVTQEAGRRDSRHGAVEEEPPPKPPKDLDTVTYARQAFRVPVRCSQGPLEMRMPALGALYSERFVVYACGPRGVRGQFTLNGGGFGVGGRFGGEKVANEACVPIRGEMPRRDGSEENDVAPAMDGHERASGKQMQRIGVGQRKRSGERNDRREREPPPPQVAAAPQPIKVTWRGDEKCAVRTPILDHRIVVSMGAPLSPGTTMELRLWADEPNDWEGVTLVVEQRSLPEGTPLSVWEEYQRKLDQFWKDYRAYLDRLPTCGSEAARSARSCVHRGPQSQEEDRSVPPPPPPRAEKQPPKPSENAVWVPGYWHYDRPRKGFVWSAGYWRVPESDIAAQRTARAPGAPPPPRGERPPEGLHPDSQLVFVPGHWAYDGVRWVWVEGAYRVPPRPGMRWRPPEWRVVPSGAVFIPGKWVDGEEAQPQPQPEPRPQP